MLRQKTTVIWAVIITILLTGVIVGQWSLAKVTQEAEHYEKLKTFTEVLSLVKKNYVEEVKDKDLIYGAIKGMLQSLDPHSSFMPPEVFKEMQVETKGEFGGIGIQIGIKDGMLTVIAPIEDTPAYKAGVKAGDKIIKINEEQTKDMSLHDAVTRLRGPKGTSVTITLMRKEWDSPRDMTIQRDIIKIHSVKSRLLEDGIGYIKLTQFHGRTGAELEKALKGLEKENINAFILDLRNNPGGVLEVSVDVSSRFLPQGKLVVSIKGRKEVKKEYHTGNSKKYYDYPMVVLVNEGSASASEIIAGAFKDHSRAVLVGTKTFGKGSVQTVIPLSDGSGLRLTTARYYTPKGTSIHTTGITPDIIVTPKARKEVPKDKEPDIPDIEEAQVEVSKEEDVQLQRAIDILKTWRILKEAPKTG